MIGAFVRDLRQATRILLRRPALSAAAVLCLALAIGANTAVFSVVNAVLLRPLPYAAPERLVSLWERINIRPTGHNTIQPANYLDWQAQSHAYTAMAALRDWQASVTGLGEPAQVPVQMVTASLFPLLGVRPVLGRPFTAAEDAPGGEAVVVLSEGFWRRHFHGDRRVLGRPLVIDGRPHSIVGVMPGGFALPGSEPELWLPLGLNPAENYRETTGRFLHAIARLAPGVTVERADAELRAIAARIAAAHPAENSGWTAVVEPLAEQAVGGARRPLLVVAGVAALVLLIACANVANLQLARAAERRREIAVRAALGADRRRIVRDLLGESLIVAGVGGVLGLLLAVWGTAALVAAAPAGLPRVAEIGVDGRALAFTAFLSLLTGLLFGLAPALQGSRADLHAPLKEGARGSTVGTRGALVAAQIALSLVLLAGAGLLLRSFVRLLREDPGFAAEGVLTAKVSLPESRYDRPERQAAFFQELLARVRALPGVRSASAVNWLPLAGSNSATDFLIEGRPTPRPEEAPTADIRLADPEYFRTLGIPVLRGEPFTERDGPSARKAVVIDETLARTYFPGEQPVGRRIRMEWGDTLTGEIVAVVGDTRHAGLDSVPRPTIYWAMAQWPWNFMTLVIRSTDDPGRLAGAVANQLHALDPDLPLADVRPLEEYLGRSVATRRFTMLLLGAFAAVALVLTVIGIAGVIANGVARRTREIGVRLALGAEPGAVLRMVLRRGMALTGVGIAAGIVGALALTRLLGSLLYGTSPTDGVTFAAVAFVLAAAALVATYVPARRAARVDPVAALRAE